MKGRPQPSLAVPDDSADTDLPPPLLREFDKSPRLTTAPHDFGYADAWWGKTLSLKCGINFAVRIEIKGFKRAASNAHLDALLRSGGWQPFFGNIYESG